MPTETEPSGAPGPTAPISAGSSVAPAQPGSGAGTPTGRQRLRTPSTAAVARIRSKVAGRLLKRPLRELGVVGAVVVLAGTAAFGGLEPAEDQQPAALEAGVTITAAPYEVTVDEVLWIEDVPGAYLTAEGNRWIAVLGSVTSTHTTSLYGTAELSAAVSLVDVPGLVREPDPLGDGFVRSDARLVLVDGSVLDPVQPGLTYETVFLFEQDGSVEPPNDVTVAAVGHTWRAGTLDRTLAWWDPARVAEGEFSVRKAQDQKEDSP